jgi:RNA polymerase sigma-70 factor (ECF subfamily)
LNPDLADDILQETMLQMVKSLKSLKDRTHFWPWLYRVASNKIAGHFRKEGHRSMVRFSAMEDHYVESLLEDEKGVFASQIDRRELHTLILKAVEKLDPVQRSVFSLRCFENFSYEQIAESVGCEMSTARVHFYRARQILQSKLKRQGITGGAVVPAMVFFGKITAGEKTLAAGITTSSVKFSTGLTTVQSVLTAVKAGFVKGIAAAAVVAAGVALTHTAWVHTHPHPYPQREQVQSVHYTVQGIGLVDEKKLAEQMKPAARIGKGDVDIGPYTSKGAYEMWTQFPEGPDGPIFVRMQRWGLDSRTHENTSKLCGWLQNGRANYYYYSGLNRVYLTNDPIGMLILPTDPPKLAEFLMEHSKYQEQIRCSYDRKTGLIKGRADSRVSNVGTYKTEYAYNILSAEDFEPFWPDDAGVVDERDAMHRRGWTYFTIEGTYKGQPVTGCGRLPFTYVKYQEYKPWLHVSIGSEMEIIDTPERAVVMYGSEAQRSAYPPETFFTGFGRPWIGIRAYDTTRRDAAKERIPFTDDPKDETGIVAVLRDSGRIEYQIDMMTDVIDKITFYVTVHSF